MAPRTFHTQDLNEYPDLPGVRVDLSIDYFPRKRLLVAQVLAQSRRKDRKQEMAPIGFYSLPRDREITDSELEGAMRDLLSQPNVFAVARSAECDRQYLHPFSPERILRSP